MSYVTIHYGPYEACGVVRHRTQRLRGLKEQLELDGHTVELIPSPHWDRCVIEIARRNVFRCRLTNFEYYTDGKDDIVCDRAMQAVRDAISRMKPSFLYPDIQLFSEEFYEEIVNDVFQILKVRECIDEVVEKAMMYLTVVESIEVAVDQATRVEFVQHIIGEAMEGAFLKDYIRDLTEANLQKFFELQDFMADTIQNAVETRDFMKDTIMEALTRTHPLIKEYIKQFTDTTFKNAASELNLKGGSFEDIIMSMVNDGLSGTKHVSIKHILNDLVDNLSLRSKTSYSLGSTESPASRSLQRSDDSFNYDGRGKSYDNSQESLNPSKSDSSRSN